MSKHQTNVNKFVTLLDRLSSVVFKTVIMNLIWYLTTLWSLLLYSNEYMSHCAYCLFDLLTNVIWVSIIGAVSMTRWVTLYRICMKFGVNFPLIILKKVFSAYLPLEYHVSSVWWVVYPLFYKTLYVIKLAGSVLKVRPLIEGINMIFRKW